MREEEEQREVEWVHHIIMGGSVHMAIESKLVAKSLWSFPVNRQLPLDS